MKTETITTLSYKEFEQLVAEQYGCSGFSFVATEECDHDSEHKFSILQKETLGTYDVQSLVELRSGRHPQFINGTILQDLVNRDILPAGKYLVEVCWYPALVILEKVGI